MDESSEDEGVVARATCVVEVGEVERLLAQGAREVFTEEELRYAGGRADPARRLAARLAAKRAAIRLLGGGVDERQIEVARGDYGPPVLRLSGPASERMRALGAGRALVSLSHERRHAAALVLLVRDGR